MSFPAYESYREIGVEWLGKVPSHWEVEPVRALASPGRSCFVDGDWIEAPFITTEGIRLIQTGNIGVGKFKEQGFRFISEETFNTLNCTEISPGDLLICRLADPVGRACIAPNLGTRMITSVDVCILKPRPLMSASFLSYFLSSPDYLGFVEGQCRGGTRDRVSRTFLGNVRVVIPPPEEQAAIAAFLDRETEKIDALVEEQKRLIELLKEKRQAVISHAVTKGLAPTAPMKDSGVEWLGEVPAHWEVVPLKRFLEILSGYAFPSQGFSSSEAGQRLLRGINVSVGQTRWDDVVYWPRSEGDGLEAFELQSGDIVLGMDRPWIGDGLRVAQLGDDDVPSLLLQRVTALRPTHDLLPRFLLNLLTGEAFHHHCVPEMSGVSVPHISPGQIGDFVVTIPPLQEQAAIVGAVDTMLHRFGELMRAAEAAISLLQERRSALISAAVTGKIDVRGIAPKASVAA